MGKLYLINEDVPGGKMLPIRILEQLRFDQSEGSIQQLEA